MGLEEAIRSHARRFAEGHGLALRLSITAVAGALATDQELHLYRIVQEALANVAHHAGARHVSVRLLRRPRHVAASVRDDGAGFDPAGVTTGASGLGLVTMRERAELMRATLDVRSEPGRGTEVQLVVPVAATGLRPRPRAHVSQARSTAHRETTRPPAAPRRRDVAGRRER